MKNIVILILIPLIVFAPVLGRAKEPAPHDPPSQEWEERSSNAGTWLAHDLPRHIGNDFKYTFWNGWHLLLLAGGTGMIVGIHEKDPEIQRSFQPSRPMGKTFDDIMKWGAHPIVLGGASLLAFGLSELYGSKKAAVTSGTMLEALALTETLTLGLQFATHRRRPDGSNNRSFPSGHTSSAFALATVTQVLHGPWFGVPAYVLASLVGVSRIDSNKHVASDVIAGALLGTLIGLGTAKFHKKEFSRYLIVPTAGDGNPGISLVYLF